MYITNLKDYEQKDYEQDYYSYWFFNLTDYFSFCC